MGMVCGFFGGPGIDGDWGFGGGEVREREDVFWAEKGESCANRVIQHHANTKVN